MTKDIPAGRYSNASHQWHKTAQAHLGWIPSGTSQTYLWSLHREHDLNILKIPYSYTTSYSSFSVLSLHKSQLCIAAEAFLIGHHSWIKMQWCYCFIRWMISRNVDKQSKWLDPILLPLIISCKHFISVTVLKVCLATCALIITRPLFQAVRFILTKKGRWRNVIMQRCKVWCVPPLHDATTIVIYFLYLFMLLLRVALNDKRVNDKRETK